MPLLLAGGAGALGHWRLSTSTLAASPALGPLFETYRAYTLEAAVRERQLAEAVSVLRSAGIEALLGKGFAAARYYAQSALRPHGDIDLFLAPDCRGPGLLALRKSGRSLPVDLHAGFAELDDRGESELRGRATVLSVQGVEVLAFGAEDHLRFLVLHLLRHGASRPPWLCDVAALVEAAGASLDWELVLAGSKASARAVASVVGLTARLLDARVPSVPELERAGAAEPPRWLEPAVLEQWGRGSGFRRPLADDLGRPARLLSSLRGRWPNPLEATAGVGARFDDRPRWPYQMAFAALRAFRFARSRGRFDG